MKTTITLALLPCANNIIACLQFSWVFVIKSELSVNITVYIVWSYRNWPWMILKVITGASLIAVQWQEKICYLEWTGYWMTLLQESSLPTEQEGKTKPEMDLKEVSIKIFQPFSLSSLHWPQHSQIEFILYGFITKHVYKAFNIQI